MKKPLHELEADFARFAPYQRVWASVLVRALEDAYGGMPGRFKLTPRICKEARKFLAGEARSVAETLGIESAEFEEHLQRYLSRRGIGALT